MIFCIDTDKIQGNTMHAEKVILETNQQGQIINLPKLPPNAQLEAIFLVLNQSPKNKKEFLQQKLPEKVK
jgi:hypothetical protein